MASLLDLARQVKGLLLPERGGTGNALGYARGVYTTGQNRTGATLARMTLVKLLGTWDDLRVTPVTTAEDTATFGVVVGGFTSDDGTRIDPYVGAGDGKPVAVLIAGITDVLISEAVTRGQYAYASGTSGKAKSSATRVAGAFGVFVESATSGNARVALGMRATSTGSETVARYGTAQDTTDLKTIDIQQGIHEHGSSTVVALEVDQPNLMIAASQVSLADAGGWFADVGPGGTEILYPTSDIVNTPSAYSSGTTTWSLIDEVVLDAADYVDLKLVSTTPCIFIVGMGASTRTPSQRITSIDIVTDLLNSAPAGTATVRMRDPATGTTYQVDTIAQGAASPKTTTLTTRPWDSRPWTLDDINHLQVGCQAAASGPFNLRVYRQRIIINYTEPATVESALAEVGSETGGSRPYAFFVS